MGRKGMGQFGSSQGPASTALELLQGTVTTHELKCPHTQEFSLSCMLTHIHTNAHVFTQYLVTHTYWYTHPYTPTRMHTCAHTDMHTHFLIHTVATHTHTRRPNRRHPRVLTLPHVLPLSQTDPAVPSHGPVSCVV